MAERFSRLFSLVFFFVVLAFPVWGGRLHDLSSSFFLQSGCLASSFALERAGARSMVMLDGWNGLRFRVRPMVVRGGMMG